jgi:hypothetical protein
MKDGMDRSALSLFAGRALFFEEIGVLGSLPMPR